MIWTIYALRVEGANDPFYIGCTCRSDYRRWIEHKSDTTKPSGGQNASKEEVISNALNLGKKIEVDLIESCESKDEAFERERFWIAHYGREIRGGILTNRNDGGVGGGVVFSPETRQKMAAAKRGNKINLGGNVRT